MAITKKPKPKVDPEKANGFVESAKADRDEPQNRNTANAVKRYTSEPQDKREPERGKPVKRRKLSFYMTPDMYIKWKEYEFKETAKTGERVTFQSVVEGLMKDVLGIN